MFVCAWKGYMADDDFVGLACRCTYSVLCPLVSCTQEAVAVMIAVLTQAEVVETDV